MLRSSFVFAMFACAALACCGGRTSEPPAGPPPVATVIEDAGSKPQASLVVKDAGASSAAPDPDDLLQEKLDRYVKCVNTLSSTTLRARRSYLAQVKREGPTGKERKVDFEWLPSGVVQECREGVETAKKIPPASTTLEDAGADFAAAAIALDALIVDVKPYFDKKEFSRDRWAKGKALHPKLLEAFTRFRDADQKLHDVLDDITKPLARRTLARIEREDGRRARYHRKNTMMNAREVVEASDPGGDDDIDLVRYEKALTGLTFAVEAFQSYSDTHRAELKDDAGVSKESEVAGLLERAQAVRKTGKELFDCLKRAPASARLAKDTVHLASVGQCGTVPAQKLADDVIARFNELVRASNKLDLN